MEGRVRREQEVVRGLGLDGASTNERQSQVVIGGPVANLRRGKGTMMTRMREYLRSLHTSDAIPSTSIPDRDDPPPRYELVIRNNSTA